MFLDCWPRILLAAAECFEVGLPVCFRCKEAVELSARRSLPNGKFGQDEIAELACVARFCASRHLRGRKKFAKITVFQDSKSAHPGALRKRGLGCLFALRIEVRVRDALALSEVSLNR